MRFDSAREAGLTEERVANIEDGYESRLGASESAALALTDAIIGVPDAIDETLRARLRRQFSEAEIQELTFGIGIFLAMSKVLINLGLEPESMPITQVPTPGARTPSSAIKSGSTATT